jgi:hypothetical protein
VGFFYYVKKIISPIYAGFKGIVKIFLKNACKYQKGAYICVRNQNKKTKIMKTTTTRQPITNERLLEIIKEEIAKNGQNVWSDRRKTAEEILRGRGYKKD